MKRLLMVCDQNSLDGVRNRALLMTLFDTGVRAGELVSMGLPDWEQRQVKVRGKTGVRNVPIGVTTLQALERCSRWWRVYGEGRREP